MQSDMYYKFIGWYIGLLCLIFMSSCKVAAPVKMPAQLTAPTSFTGKVDTSSIGYIPRKAFFTDPQLNTLIDEALANNLDVKIAIQHIEAARAELVSRRSLLLPTVGVGASAGVRKFGAYTMDGVGNFDTNFSENIGEDKRIPDPLPDYFLGLQSSWEIDIWGKLKNQKKAAYARFLASEKGRQLIITSLVAQIANLYYELLALDSELEIIRENISLQQRAVELVNVQKLAGRVTELAVQQFTAQLLNTKGLEAEIRQEIIEVENALNLLAGRYPQPILRGSPITDQALPNIILTGVPSELLRRRPDIGQAELALVAAKADVQATRAAFFPSLTINSFIGLQSFKAAFLFTTPESIAFNLLGGLSAPLLNRNQLKGIYKRATAEQMAAFYSYQQTVLIGFGEVVNSLKGIENFTEQSEFKKQEATMLQQAVASSNDLFVAGYATYLEVVTAQERVLEAELALTAVKKRQFAYLIQLYRALGGGWEEE